MAEMVDAEASSTSAPEGASQFDPEFGHHGSVAELVDAQA